MELIVIEIFLQAFLLMSLLFVVARHEADFSFDKVVIVTAVITLVSFLLNLILQPKIGILHVIPSAGFFIFMIIRYCWVSWWKALLITILFYLFYFMFMILIAYLLKEAFENNAPETLTEKKGKEMMEAVNISREILGVQQINSTNTPIPTPDSTINTKRQTNPEPMQTSALPKEFESEQDAARRQLDFKGFMTDKDGKRTALVNGHYLSEGETIAVEYKQDKYIWKLTKIGKYGPDWELVSRNQ